MCFILGDFDMHVDVPVGDCYKLCPSLTYVISKSWLVKLPIRMVDYSTSFYSPIIRMRLSNFVIICSRQSSVACLGTIAHDLDSVAQQSPLYQCV